MSANDDLFTLDSAAHSGCCPPTCSVSSRVNPNDIWMTPDNIAADMVNHFGATGRRLEPCKGDGAFVRAMPGCDWCEVREGRDFFAWQAPVDWIVSNPPYSIFTDFHAHAMKIAENIVWLIPLHKPFGSWPRMSELRKWGWMKEIRIYGRSRDYGLDVGFVCGAIHFQRGWEGDTAWSFYPQNVQGLAQIPAPKDSDS